MNEKLISQSPPEPPLPPMDTTGNAEPEDVIVSRDQIQEWYAKTNSMRAAVLSHIRGENTGVDWAGTMRSVIEVSAIMQLQLDLVTTTDIKSRASILDQINRIREFKPTSLTV